MAHANDEAHGLTKTLPPWMPKDTESGNYKLFGPAGDAITRQDEDIEAVDRAATVQHADTIDQLFELAKLVDLPQRVGENKEQYRARIFAEFQLVTNEATPAELILTAANILDVTTKSINYEELAEEATIRLGVPGKAVDALAISETDFASIMDRIAAAGVRIESVKIGTFTYITPDDYNDVNFVHDPDKGYSTDADLDGNPDAGGGTYSGLIN